MSPDFKKLLELERSEKILIGIHRSHANNFWYSTTFIGKILNWLVYLFIPLIILVLVKFGVLWGIAAAAFNVVYVIVVQDISFWYVRSLFRKDENLFNAAYNARSIILTITSENKIVSFPSDWQKEIGRF